MVMMTADLHYLSISELAPMIERKEISPVEVTRHMLDRIGKIDGDIRAYALVMAESAIDQAKQAESEIAAGEYRGPLHGVPIAVKDLCNTEGVATMGGSAVFTDNVPDHDSTVVARLNASGAVMLGKLNMTEGAMGGYNPALQYPENPWKQGYFPGASSSGSGAATSAGLAFGTLGSDTGGSIRGPAAVCGTVGLKPTWGRVSRYGVMDLAASLDHVGPLTRSSIDAGYVLQAIAGQDASDPTSRSEPVPDMTGDLATDLTGLKVGWDERYASEDMDPDYATAVASGVKVLEGLGATIVDVTVTRRLREYLAAWAVVCSSEAYNAHQATYPSRAEEYGPWFRQWLENGSNHTGAEYAAALELRNASNGELRVTMDGIDILAFPGFPKTAHAVSSETMWGPIPDDRDSWSSRFTAPYDYSGLPTLNTPCGLSDGLPMSIQFAAHPLQEPLLVKVGNAYEQATDWNKARPPGWQ
jgi:amidase